MKHTNYQSRWIKIKTLWGIFIIGILWSTILSVYANNDLLNQAFEEAKRFDVVVNPGNDKNAVWGQVFNETKEVNVKINLKGNLKDAFDKTTSTTKEPYLIRLTKLILRVMIAISVSIIIYGGISYSLSFGDEKKQLAARNIVIYALTGILIGLASLAIIELVLSITKSSLHF